MAADRRRGCQRAAKKAGQKLVREQRHAQQREKIHAKIEELKAKFHRHKAADEAARASSA